MKLLPYSPQSGLSVEAKLESGQKTFTLSFEVTGDALEKVVLPSRSQKPERKNELWKQTCFECFFSVGNSSRYYEFNGSPSGDWALYAFDDYRAGMKEVVFRSSAVTPVMETIERTAEKINCVWRIPQFTEEFFDRAGVTAVINDGTEISYWAIKHAGEKPDFHLKGSFIHRFF
jgi:hypothetical protein